jgi:hypothetical protein
MSKAETLLHHHDKNDCSTSKTRETLLVEDGNDKVQSTPSELFNGETTDKLIRREDNVLQNEIGDFTREISESLPFLLNFFPHISQVYGCSPLCISMCSLRALLLEKSFLQN